MLRRSSRKRKAPERYEPEDWRELEGQNALASNANANSNVSSQNITHICDIPAKKKTMSFEDLQQMENWRDHYFTWLILYGPTGNE